MSRQYQNQSYFAINSLWANTAIWCREALCQLWIKYFKLSASRHQIFLNQCLWIFDFTSKNIFQWRLAQHPNFLKKGKISENVVCGMATFLVRSQCANTTPQKTTQYLILFKILITFDYRSRICIHGPGNSTLVLHRVCNCPSIWRCRAISSHDQIFFTVKPLL